MSEYAFNRSEKRGAQQNLVVEDLEELVDVRGRVRVALYA